MGLAGVYDYTDTTDRSYYVRPSEASKGMLPAWMWSRFFLAALGFTLAGCSPQVPNVVGLKVDKAEERLQRAGFKSAISFQDKFEVPSGEVISQQPKGQDRAESGSVVKLSVSKGATITGSFTLIDEDLSSPATVECTGTGGYSDIQAGLQVTVKNERGDILGVGELGPNNSNYNYSCTYPFKIENISKAIFYEIEVGRRGSLKYSLEELKTAGWEARFSLGT